MAPEDRAAQTSVSVYTIGYGARDIAAFLDVLRAHDIGYLLDVRSTPYSRFKPEFSKDALARTVREQGIQYLYLGHQLGGQPDDPSCYQGDGKVDYAVVAQLPAFRVGLERVERAYRQGRRVKRLRPHRPGAQGHFAGDGGRQNVHQPDIDILRQRKTAGSTLPRVPCQVVGSLLAAVGAVCHQQQALYPTVGFPHHQHRAA